MYAFYRVLSSSFLLLPPQGLKSPGATPAAELQGALENPGGSEASAAQSSFYRECSCWWLRQVHTCWINEET